ncbi:glycerophosphodiester phosphodiesterase [Fibrella aquatica]|uniref:glycerophosphodiester phosphodiesterase n=1 Tax=Fibrella aquatica TaxID=3242487 RepID=UPI00351FB3D0
MVFFRLIILCLIALSGSYLAGCRAGLNDSVPIPPAYGEGLNVEGAKLLFGQTRKACEGVYTASDGADAFGQEIAAKWSHLVKSPGDTTYYLSLFCEPQAAFFVLEGRQIGDSLVFEGFWRRLVNAETGTARFVVLNAEGGSVLLAPDCCTTVEPGQVIFRGGYGNGQNPRSNSLVLTYNRPLNPRPFQILAHRGGGRTSDLLPSSENSIEIIRLAERLGATGIEIDIRQTKDGTPIIYHDNQLNLRLTQKTGLIGAVEAYTFDQLSAFVRLRNGERIPKLTAALDEVLNNTALETVWLDAKDVRDMDLIRTIQQTYQQRATQQGRKLTIYIGLPSADEVAQFEALPDHTQLASICELDTSVVRRINARVWAPRWTLGEQVPSTQAMQEQGRKVFIWTLDVPEFIQQFVQNGTFDGILSNYAPIVAYYHYVQQ